MRGKLFRRVAPLVAFVAVLTQGNLGWAGKTTTTTLTTKQIVDGMSVGQDLILSQKDGMGTLGAHGDAVTTDINIGMDPGDCTNHVAGASLVTLNGTLSHGPSFMRLRVQTGSKAGSGQTSDYWAGSANFDVTLAGVQNKTLPKQPIPTSSDLMGVGGNPYIYIRFKGANQNNSGWQYLGRCVQGSTGSAHATLSLPGRRFLRVTSSSCTTTGSSLALRHRGGPKLNGDLAFTNQRVDVENGAPLSDAAHFSGPMGFESASVGVTFQTGGVTFTGLGTWAGGNPAFGAGYAPYDEFPNAAAAALGKDDDFHWSSTFMLGRCKDFAGTMPVSGIDLEY